MLDYLPAGQNDDLLRHDYSHAQIDLIWRRDGNVRALILALVTLQPSECPRTSHRRDSCVKMRSVAKKCELNFQRFSVDLDDALAWIAALQDGVGFLPSTRDRALGSGAMQLEPDHGGWNVGNGYPFSDPQASAYARIRHWVQSPQPEAALQVWRDPDASAWIESVTGIRLLDHETWCGSIHLVAPNPVYRRLEHRLLTSEDGSDRMFVQFTPRASRSVQGLQLTVAEVRPYGFGTIHTVSVEEAQFTLSRKGVMNQVALAVSCPKRGLLEWHGPVGWFRGPPANALPGQLSLQSWKGRMKEKAQELDQRWFFSDLGAAESYVRQLFARAMTSILIFDPYFADTEMDLLDNAIHRHGVRLTIVTSASRLKADDEFDRDEYDCGGKRLIELVPKYKAQFDLRILVTRGMPIHDRFIVIDDDLRFSGNSLQRIGERGSLVMRVPEPSGIVGAINEVIAEATPLDEWLPQYLKMSKRMPKDDLLQELPEVPQ
jgi:hypothetical protein